jgi:hypothetical protein
MREKAWCSRKRRTLLAGAAGEQAGATRLRQARPSSACTFSARIGREHLTRELAGVARACQARPLSMHMHANLWRYQSILMARPTWVCTHLKPTSHMIGAVLRRLSQSMAPKSPARRHSAQRQACLFVHALGNGHPRSGSANRGPCRCARCTRQTWRGPTAARCGRILQTTNLQHRTQYTNA